VTDAFSLFDDAVTAPSHTPLVADDRKMTESQRARIRELFRQLGIVEARDQFTLVKELTGQDVTSVTQVSEADARKLILLLPAKIESLRSRHTGNAWSDRTEDTWIDRL
jgi:hypothetical protein